MSNQSKGTPNKKEALGKGIRSLLANIDTDLKQTSNALNEQVVVQATGIERLPLDQIDINPKQPRRDFDEKALQELSMSISLHDVIQPITVSKLGPKKYQLIAGERRLRASRMAGLKDIPAYIRQANDQELLELALLENLQRENLNAIEIGLSYKRLMDEVMLTQEQVADRMGKERSTVTNYIRLLKLPPDIQVSVRNGQISMGHARALIAVENVEKQLFIFNEIMQNGLSVRQTEELVRKVSHIDKGNVKKPAKSTLPPPYQKIEDNLASHFSTKVKLDRNKNGKGSVTIEFYSDEELDSILEKIDLYGG
ncbi:MAG: parB-like partition protein [Bacteroidetes bacterium]|uniref:ParB/RepB/Spo0J family partition protein n=1 Tax=Chitinophaga TaxID=79328 RepID=UPI0009D18EE3|nr:MULTISPECIES: ParB/RepB/Spo0J family partition protein [Chitinophaga]MBP1652159.1 parB-like partition protein [Bacteroidota bacterium]OMP80904.1 chromosome partitioning protein ParB [[Flexibacter] sp. ATCC 35208]WPQ65478.1 ParB/RepB/Spo0J family partition protein [Chitinophaga sancti]WPV69950.1 ParB/RepB/Spo0J family partition protein [Chitinophaga sp. LS1]